MKVLRLATHVTLEREDKRASLKNFYSDSIRLMHPSL
jgi:hypothetical protein